MSFSQNVLRLRRQNALTQRQMAERLGVTLSQFRHFETKGGQPSLAVLKTFAGRFGVSLDWLICDRGERRALQADLQLQFEAIGRLRLDERRAIRALLDELIRQYMAKRNLPAKPRPAPGAPPPPVRPANRAQATDAPP
ncbi:helix-turn-helix transcriptional regulator [Pseudomonas aeruginosa]|nr:helix-turn-helix transcriptional regulator [Pseudomonas aeruginosa]